MMSSVNYNHKDNNLKEILVYIVYSAPVAKQSTQKDCYLLYIFFRIFFFFFFFFFFSIRLFVCIFSNADVLCCYLIESFI